MHDPANLDIVVNLIVGLGFAAFALVGFGALRIVARLAQIGPPWLTGKRAEPQRQAEPPESEIHGGKPHA